MDAREWLMGFQSLSKQIELNNKQPGTRGGLPIPSGKRQAAPGVGGRTCPRPALGALCHALTDCGMILGVDIILRKYPNRAKPLRTWQTTKELFRGIRDPRHPISSLSSQDRECML